MSEHTWTDQDLRDAGVTSEYGVGVFGTAPRSFLAKLGAVHPVEVRERERRAWDAAICHSANVPERRVTGEPWDDPVRDRRFPSLLPQSPPPLVLSTGEFMLMDGRWIAKSPTSLGVSAPPCRTASDARALAEWLSKYGSDDERK